MAAQSCTFSTNAISIVLVFVIPVYWQSLEDGCLNCSCFVISVYRTKHEDWCRYCPCVCGFRVRTTIRLLSVLFCCLWFQCTDRAMRTAGSIVLVGLVLQLCLHRSLGQVYSRNVLPTANQPQNNAPPPSVWKRGKKKMKFTILKVVAMRLSLVR